MGQGLWFQAEKHCRIVSVEARPTLLVEVVLTTSISHGRLQLQVERPGLYPPMVDRQRRGRVSRMAHHSKYMWIQNWTVRRLVE